MRRLPSALTSLLALFALVFAGSLGCSDDEAEPEATPAAPSPILPVVQTPDLNVEPEATNAEHDSGSRLEEAELPQGFTFLGEPDAARRLALAQGEVSEIERGHATFPHSERCARAPRGAGSELPANYQRTTSEPPANYQRS